MKKPNQFKKLVSTLVVTAFLGTVVPIVYNPTTIVHAATSFPSESQALTQNDVATLPAASNAAWELNGTKTGPYTFKSGVTRLRTLERNS
jgi:hypothetical protein